MTIIIASVIFAAFLPILTKAPLGLAQSKLPGGYDNRHPRVQQAALEGFGQRALGAHNNAFEAFPPFAVGVLLALWAQAPVVQVQTLCLVWIVARVLHAIFYLADVNKLRSLCWGIAFGSSIWLMCLALPG